MKLYGYSFDGLHITSHVIAIVALFVACFAITGYITFRDRSIPDSALENTRITFVDAVVGKGANETSVTTGANGMAVAQGNTGTQLGTDIKTADGRTVRQTTVTNQTGDTVAARRTTRAAASNRNLRLTETRSGARRRDIFSEPDFDKILRDRRRRVASVNYRMPSTSGTSDVGLQCTDFVRDIGSDKNRISVRNVGGTLSARATNRDGTVTSRSFDFSATADEPAEARFELRDDGGVDVSLEHNGNSQSHSFTRSEVGRNINMESMIETSDSAQVEPAALAVSRRR